MPFLSLTGYGTLEILVAGATQDEGDTIGQATRSFSGMMRSSLQENFERYRFTVGPITQTQHAALRTALAANGFIGAWTGDAIVAGNYLTRIGSADYVRDASEANDFRRTLSLTLERAD